MSQRDTQDAELYDKLWAEAEAWFKETNQYEDFKNWQKEHGIAVEPVSKEE